MQRHTDFIDKLRRRYIFCTGGNRSYYSEITCFCAYFVYSAEMQVFQKKSLSAHRFCGTI